MKGLPDRDFKQLNRLSIKDKAVTCHTQYNFRQFTDARLKEKVRDKGIVLPEEEFTYGKGNRPSTPVKAVVQGFYSDVAEQQIGQRYELLKEQSKPISLVNFRNHTRASQMVQETLRSTMRDEEMRSSKTLFKMRKFQQVQPRTNTHNGLRRVGSQAVFGNSELKH